MQELFQIKQQTLLELRDLVEDIKFGKDPKELLKQIRDLEIELKRVKKIKKYGLIFEEKPEEFEEDSKNALPLLKEVKKLSINNQENSPTNIIIEGDNYHALSCLQYTHKGKIDVIYIDPPYNTGNKDFIYNDNYIDKEDSFRHSKWLSFMKKRLDLAKDLLSEKGVIFISIDDNEFAQLKLLCDGIFGENNFIRNMIWESNKNIMKGSNHIRKDNEYILVYSKNKELLTINKLKNNIKFTNIDNDEKGPWISTNATYTKGGFIFSINLPDGSTCIRNWRFSEKEFLSGKVPLYFNKGNVPRLKVYEKDYNLESKTPSSLILDLATSTNAKNDLGIVFEVDSKNIPFDTPKPLKLINYLLKISSSQNSIILDFFAGSGTTGHAVLELNHEDSGNRQFILCSNKENTKENPEKNICLDITYERNKRIIQGYTNNKGEDVLGLGGNLKYYQTDFIKIEKSRENLKTKFKNNCNDLLCIKENTFIQVKLAKEIPGIFIYKNDSSYTIISYEHIFLDEIKDLCKILDKKINLYLFSLSSHFEEDFEDIKDKVELKSIPESILEVYKKIFNF